MGKMLGMDPDTVRARAAQLQAQLQSLESAAETIDRVAAASLNPLSYGIMPGGLVVAPFAIVTTHSAAAQVRSAMGSVHELVFQLFDEAREQTQVSSASNASYRQFRFRKAGAPTRPGDAWWKGVPGFLKTTKDIFGLVKKVLTYPRIGYSLYYMARYARDIRTLGALKGAWNWAASQAPKWMQVADDIARSPVMSVIGKGLSVVGSVLSVGTAVGTWLDPASSGWDKTRDTVGAALAVTGTVLLFIPGVNVGVVAAVAVAGAAWAIGSAIYDNRKAIGDFVGKVGDTVGNVVSSAGKAIGGAVDHAVDVVKNGFGFIGHAFGW